MKQVKIIITLFLAVVAFTACQKDKYEVEIPEAGVLLKLPVEGDFLDLNNEEITTYTFSWDKICEGGNSLIFSSSPLLLDTVMVMAGEVDSYTIDVQDADVRFSTLGIGGGKSGTVYWAVKPTNKISAAASEIRSFTTRRIQTQLIAPEDQAEEVLNIDTPEREVLFSWKVDKEEPGTEYQLSFSMDSRMEKSKVVVDAGNTGECKLTYQQLQNILQELPINLYTQNKIYWNAVRKSDGSFISRTSHVLKLTDMLIFTDIRGDEKIIYRVAKLKYSNGEEVIWLAENLRATKYPDGSEISIENYERWKAPADVSEGHQKAYGYYYSVNIADKIVPKGWKMPSSEDYLVLVSEARNCENGQTNVLKHPVYWNWNTGVPEYANAWGLGLTANGYIPWAGADGNPANYNGSDSNCYLLASDLQNKVALISEYGCSQGEIYRVDCWGGAPVRLIYVGK